MQQNIPENYEVVSGAPLMYFGEKNAKDLIIMLHGEYSSLQYCSKVTELLGINSLLRWWYGFASVGSHLQFTYKRFKEIQALGVNVAICCIAYGI
jgi:hypothetical protein